MMGGFEISHHSIMESANYMVCVGTVPGDKVPQYLIFHKKYQVLEYAHNNVWVLPQALAEMENHIAKMDQAKPETTPEPDKGLYN